ncbi:MAG: hypothetical protein KDI54_19475, partial [Gammaproteobacteria bacterium]|nr:hypothetical protein [Gammaproteobacteria bacterium]
MAANSLDSGLRRNDELIGFSGNFSLSKCHSDQTVGIRVRTDCLSMTRPLHCLTFEPSADHISMVSIAPL